MEIVGTLFLLFILVFIGFIVSLKLSVARHQAITGVPHPSELPADVRHQTAKLRRLREDMERTIKGHRDIPEVQVVGKEALEASADLIRKITYLATQRESLRRAHQHASISETEEAQLELKLAQSTSIAERESIERTLANYRRAKDHLEDADNQLGDFQQQVLEAEATLSELHSRIATMTAMGARVSEDELRDTLGRLRSLNTTMDEVQATLPNEARP
ncbi:MAG: hypothetical protein JSS65_14860 [Armatimonadetes bacterium]|nr:hypothetical protein [Armatimonadota bacterium]